MKTLSKQQKKHLKRLIGLAYERELENALDNLKRSSRHGGRTQ